MALRTVSNTGGNWNATTAWVGGVVPIAGDTVDFTATSGPLTVNVSTATLIGIDFTNYVNTITFNQPINTNGTVNLGTGGYTQDGTNGLIVNGATTISGTTTWSRTISFTGTTYVITLSNTLNITGQVTFSQTGTLSFSVGVNTFNPTGNILVAHGTTTLPNNLNIVNLSAIPSTTTQPTLNGNTINISGNLTLSSSVSGMFLGGTTNLVLNGSGSQTWSHSGTAMQLRNNLTISASGIITISGIVYYNTGILTYTGGTVTTTSSTLNIGTSTTLNTSGIPWNNITVTATSTLTLTSNLAWSGTFSITAGNTTFSGVGTMSGAALSITTIGGTVILNNDITCTGLVTLGVGGGTGCTLNSSGGTRTIITSGGITNATTSSFITCNINIKVTGGTITSSGSLSGGYYQINTGYQFEIDGNVTFSSSTFYIYGGVSTGTGGTFKYTSGTVTTTGSAIWIQAMYFNPGSIGWNNLWFISGTASTTVLQSDVIVNGLLTLGYTAIGYTINNDGSIRTITANNGITMSGTTSVVLGTANIKCTNGTITGVSSVQLRNNLELVGNITFASGVTFSYNTGTLLYTSGTITTTNSVLSIAASTTLNTLGISWNNIVISAGTQTLTSNLNINGNLTLQTSNPTINGLFNVNVGGNLAINAIVTGTATIVLNGTGTWTHLNSSSTLLNNITINTSGTITISGIIYYGTGTILYTSGTVITTGSTLTITSGTISTNTMLWNNITFATNGSFTMAIGSNLYLNGTFLVGGAGTINGVFNIYCNNFTINNSTSGASVVVATMSQTVYVYNTLTFGFSSSGTGSNGAIFYVNGSLALGNGGTNAGTSQVIMTGTGTITGTNIFNHPLTFNSSGVITIPTSLTTTTTALTYTNGYINASTATLTCGNIATPQTLTNMHKIAWKTVSITSGSTLTMNEFFSGRPGIRTNINPSSTTNYTISFQDRFEKFSRFVKVSRATLSNPGQLTVTTDKGNQLNNVGIKFAPNNINNGLAKNTPSVQSTPTYGLQPTYLVADPTLS